MGKRNAHTKKKTFAFIIFFFFVVGGGRREASAGVQGDAGVTPFGPSGPPPATRPWARGSAAPFFFSPFFFFFFFCFCVYSAGAFVAHKK